VSLADENFLWEQVCDEATQVGLDTSLFGERQREVVARVAAFLEDEPDVRRFSFRKSAAKPIAPIILYGPPGTGKTTFLYVLDHVLRRELPDHIAPVMQKGSRTYSLQKRLLDGEPLSLLSVSQWAQLLHFYEWDVRKHRLVSADRQAFITNNLIPMRIIFTDEVEMVGYSPTIPTLAKNGILVVGTSNQTEFAQLERQQIPPHKIHFGGEDMRQGDPQDAVCAHPIFDRLAAQKMQLFGQVNCQLHCQAETVFVRLDFSEALQAPLLDIEWVNFIKMTRFFVSDPTSLTQKLAYILLLDDFSIEKLQHDYNGIIRIVALFDAVEQMGIGVLLRNTVQPLQLSRDSFAELKRVIEQADDASEDVKRKTLVGIDRFTSRLGMAGKRAQLILA
jgi:hypothetical protein